MKTFYKDLLLISHLRENGRKKLTEIARQTKMPVSSVYDKLNFYKNVFIKRYTALINFVNLGFTVRCLVAIKTNPNEKNILMDFLYKHKSINTLFRVDNGCDFIAETIFTDLENLHNFLDILEKSFDIKKIVLYNIIGEVKREDFLSNPRYLQIVNGIQTLGGMKHGISRKIG